MAGRSVADPKRCRIPKSLYDILFVVVLPGKAIQIFLRRVSQAGFELSAADSKNSIYENTPRYNWS